MSDNNFPEISIIVAMTESGLIGKDGGLPWKSSIDMDWFKKHTTHWPVIVGRHTKEGMGANFPLKNRPCAFVTKKDSTERLAFDNLYFACSYFRNFDKIFIAGGANLYNFALDAVWNTGKPLVDRIFKTVFPDGYAEGDKYLGKETLAKMSDPHFSIGLSTAYKLDPKDGTYYQNHRRNPFSAQGKDTLFPWVRFEILERNNQKGK